MPTVFIAGSISIRRLHDRVQERINKIVSSNLDVVVGDADGADTSIQECLFKCRADRVTVYCTGDAPRNNVAEWPVHKVSSKAKVGTRSYFTAKDLEMARQSDYGLMIWDCKSTGTLSNVIELLKERKKSVVFVNKRTDFVTICDRAGLNHLLTFMSDNARAKAEEKIGLSSKIADLQQEPIPFEALAATQAFPGPESAAKMPDDLVVSALQSDASQAPEAEDRAGFSPTVAGPGQEQLPFPASPTELASPPQKPVFSSTDQALSASVPANESPARSQSTKLRSALISSLNEHISRACLSPSQAAKIFGVTQPRISDLSREKVDLFGLDALVNMAETAGLRVEMHVFEPGQSQSPVAKAI